MFGNKGVLMPAYFTSLATVTGTIKQMLTCTCNSQHTSQEGGGYTRYLRKVLVLLCLGLLLLMLLDYSYAVLALAVCHCVLQ
jgi:hypothetical protein